MNNILDRIQQIADNENITITALEREIGASKGVLSGAMLRGTGIQAKWIQSIVEKFPLYNTEWLLTGHGGMLKSANLTSHYQAKLPEKLKGLQIVPCFTVEAAANLSTIFADGDDFVDGYIALPNMPSVDGALPVRGDSMYPLLKAGDIVIYKKLSSPEYIIFGQMHIVEYEWDGDTHVVVKYVNKSEMNDCVRLVSYNQYHDPMDIEIGNIRALAIVKVSIRYNTMK